MSRLQLLTIFLCFLPLAACLRCYTCVVPAISPLDCLKLSPECPAGQRCLSSTATRKQGTLKMTMYEKGCVVPSQCVLKGEKITAGLSFNFTSVCCDTDLCNRAVTVAVLSWRGASLCLPAAFTLLLS